MPMEVGVRIMSLCINYTYQYTNNYLTNLVSALTPEQDLVFCLVDFLQSTSATALQGN